MNELTQNLKKYLSELESSSGQQLEEVATNISGLVLIEERKGEISPVLMAIERLALDLEVPEESVEKFAEKKAKLIELIKSL